MKVSGFVFTPGEIKRLPPKRSQKPDGAHPNPESPGLALEDKNHPHKDQEPPDYLDTTGGTRGKMIVNSTEPAMTSVKLESQFYLLCDSG